MRAFKWQYHANMAFNFGKTEQRVNASDVPKQSMVKWLYNSYVLYSEVTER